MKIKRNIAVASFLCAQIVQGDSSCCDTVSRNVWQPRAFSSYSLTNILFLKDINLYESLSENSRHLKKLNRTSHI